MNRPFMKGGRRRGLHVALACAEYWWQFLNMNGEVHAHWNVPPCHGQLHFPVLDVFLNALLPIQETLQLPSWTVAYSLFVPAAARQEHFIHPSFHLPPFLGFATFCINFFVCGEIWFTELGRFLRIFSSNFPASIFPTLVQCYHHHHHHHVPTGVRIFCGVNNLICIWAERSGWPYHLPSLHNWTLPVDQSMVTCWSSYIRRRKKIEKPVFFLQPLQSLQKKIQSINFAAKVHKSERPIEFCDKR